MTKLSHLDDKGAARMVDVSDKAATHRTARAEGFVAMAPATLALIEAGETKKGDVFATARIAAPDSERPAGRHYFISSMTCFSSAGISRMGTRDTSIAPSRPFRTTRLQVE